MVRRTRTALGSLPGLLRLGLLVLIAGGTMDSVAHAAPLAWTSTLPVSLHAIAHGAHLVTLLGMLLTSVGIVVGRHAHEHVARPEPTPIERWTERRR